jgi:hypothetical protein
MTHSSCCITTNTIIIAKKKVSQYKREDMGNAPS